MKMSQIIRTAFPWGPLPANPSFPSAKTTLNLHLEPGPFPALCSPPPNPWPLALTTVSLSLNTVKSVHFTKALRMDRWDSLCFPCFLSLHVAGKKEQAGLEHPWKAEVLRLESPWELIGNADSHCPHTQDSHSVLRDAAPEICILDKLFKSVLVQEASGFGRWFVKKATAFSSLFVPRYQLHGRWLDET